MKSIETNRLNQNMTHIPLPGRHAALSARRGTRKNISIPGILAPALRLRMREFGHSKVSPFVIDLICYDLRSNASHTITLAIARDSQAAQDAVDTELAARYKPGQPRNGLLVQLVEHLHSVRAVARQSTVPVPLRAKPERITLPALIWPEADIRWRKLGYASFSAYVTGLIRYDLLVGGPHFFNASDTRRVILAALDRETKAARETRRSRKIFLDHLIERVHGSTLSASTLEQTKAKIAGELLRHIGGTPRRMLQDSKHSSSDRRI